MTRAIVILAVIQIVTFGTCNLNAQSAGAAMEPSTTYWREHRNDLKLDKNSIPVSVDEIPTKLQKTFRSNDLYRGWENSPLYLDKNTALYNLYIKKDSTITVYGFDDHGKAVTYNSYTIHDE